MRKDPEKRNLLKKLAQGTGNRCVCVGFIEGDAQPGKATVTQIAKWNHDGTGTIPSRPFLRNALAANKPDTVRMLSKAGQAVLKGKLSPDDALRVLGEYGRGEVIKEINSSVPPPNAPSTIAQKGSATTLVDTGVMKSHVTFVIRDLPAGNQ